MLGPGITNGRRVTDVIIISGCALIATAGILIRTVLASDTGVFRELWVQVMFTICSSFASLLLMLAIVNGLLLIQRSKTAGGSLGLPNWSSSAAIVCLMSSVGLFMSTISITILTVLYALAKRNFWIVLTVGLMAVFTLLGCVTIGFLAHSAYRDEGEDVVEFENTPDKARHFWTAEDDAEIAQESGLQY